MSPTALHKLWKRNTARGERLELEDPLTAIQPGGDLVDIGFSFPLFDRYIYSLVNDVVAVRYATKQVLEDFQSDGVSYLELRTTPRENLTTAMTMVEYVAAVNDTIRRWNNKRQLH